MNIASQVAQGLRYLHGAEPSVVHRDLNSRCIFLDEQCNAKISGFGLDGFQVCLTVSVRGREEDSFLSLIAM